MLSWLDCDPASVASQTLSGSVLVSYQQYAMPIPVIGEISDQPTTVNSSSFVVDTDPGVDDVLAMFVFPSNICYPSSLLRVT